MRRVGALTLVALLGLGGCASPGTARITGWMAETRIPYTTDRDAHIEATLARLVGEPMRTVDGWRAETSLADGDRLRVKTATLVIHRTPGPGVALSDEGAGFGWRATPQLRVRVTERVRAVPVALPDPPPGRREAFEDLDAKALASALSADG